MEVKPRVTPHALAKQEMAREKARIMRKKPTAISELEQAAQKWQEDKETQLIYRERDESPISVCLVPLRVKGGVQPKDEEIIWKQHRLHPEERKKRLKMNAPMISCVAQHLRAREWARAMGKTRWQPNSYSLEEAAKQWQRQKELEQRGFPGTKPRGTS